MINQTSSKIWILIIFVILIAGGILSWQYWKGTKEEPPMVEPTINWKVYKNEKYGFSLTFPERWRGYTISEEKDMVYSEIKYLVFSLKHSSGQYKSVFKLGVYPEERWTTLQGEEGPKPTHLIQKNNYIFAYSIGHDDEGFVGFPEIAPGTIYQGPFYDVINFIIPSFTLNEIAEAPKTGGKFIYPAGIEQWIISIPQKIQWELTDFIMHYTMSLTLVDTEGQRVAGIIYWNYNKEGINEIIWDVKTLYSPYSLAKLQREIIPGRYKLRLEYKYLDQDSRVFESDYFNIISQSQ